MRDLVKTVVYPHPIERVWGALTDPDALSRWLMPTDFRPEVGHRFTFRTDPGPGFDGVVRCEVLSLEAPHRMVWSWAGGPIDTTVVFQLRSRDGSTELTFRQSGFEGVSGFLTRMLLASGTRTIYDRRLPALLETGSAHPATRTVWERLRHRLLTKGPRQ